MKLSLFADEMTVRINYPKVFTKKRLELRCELKPRPQNAKPIYKTQLCFYTLLMIN